LARRDLGIAGLVARERLAGERARLLQQGRHDRIALVHERGEDPAEVRRAWAVGEGVRRLPERVHAHARAVDALLPARARLAPRRAKRAGPPPGGRRRVPGHAGERVGAPPRARECRAGRSVGVELGDGDPNDDRLAVALRLEAYAHQAVRIAERGPRRPGWR